jgi:hypothetical protein
MRARVIARSPLNHIVRVWAPRWARRNTRSAVPYRQPSCVCAAGRLRVTRDVCVGCATELVPCANGWVGSRVRECGVRVLPYNEIMQEEDDLKLQLNTIAGFKAGRYSGRPCAGVPGPATRSPGRRSQFPGNVSVIDVSVQHCDLVSAGRVSTSCDVASRVLRARLLSRPRAPVPTSARPVPSRPDLRLAEPPKSKVNTRLTGRDRLMPCSQCALTHSDHISQAPAERAR